MKSLTAAALATAAALSLGACSPSTSTTNDTAVTDLSTNEGDVAADGNFGAIDDFGNTATGDNLVLANDTLGNAGLANEAAPGNAL